MPFAAALSEHPLATHATGEVVGQVLDQLGDHPDVAVLFATGPFAGAFEDIAHTVDAALKPRALIGATAVSVLAGGQEVEEQAAVALFAGTLPRRAGSQVQVGRLTAERTGHGLDDEADGWRIDSPLGLVPGSVAPGATLVLLADPFSFPVDAFVQQLGADHPGLQVVGGMASAARGPGGNRLVAGPEVAATGAVGLLLPPGIGARAVVSQGCRPVGAPMVVTRSERNVIYEIAGQPALDRFFEVAEHLSPDDRALLSQGPQVGLVVDESKLDFGPGDFLVRNVLGADRENRAVAVGDEVEVGTTVQFHLRDAVSADEDLHDVLDGVTGSGALVFTCNGRGTRLFDEPDHDAQVISDQLGHGAVAGMFCAGEIGPVGGTPFLHGFTASILVFD